MSSAWQSGQEASGFAVEACDFVAVEARNFRARRAGHRLEFWDAVGEVMLGIDGFADCSTGLRKIDDVFIM